MRKYTDEQGRTIVEMTREERGPLTEEQINRLKSARARGVDLTDPDCPPMSESMRRQAELIVADRQRARARQLAAQAH